ncbi:PTN5 phosphatase, partial [Polypterus senegalus]
MRAAVTQVCTMTELPTQTTTKEEQDTRPPPPPPPSPPTSQTHLWDKLRQIVLTVGCSICFCLISQILGVWALYICNGYGAFSAAHKVLDLLQYLLSPIEEHNSAQDEILHCLKVFAPSPPFTFPDDRRQSMSRQPSFTYSEWTDAKQEDFFDLDPVPETPVFDCFMDIKPESDPATLTVKPVGLQERRGSNVSLTLDMCTPGSTEPYGSVLSPREQSAREYLQKASNVLTAMELHERAMDSFTLQAEFFETPMNFVDPKEYNIPGVVRKNRYKTILPNTHSRVCLKSTEEDDFLSTYINANYIRKLSGQQTTPSQPNHPLTFTHGGSLEFHPKVQRAQLICAVSLQGYGGEEKVYIATQGPTVNTVSDFWRMVWQEQSPIIVMITNIEEKNEKCTEYWPEDSVTYEGIEITIQQVIEADDYSLRLITLKCNGEKRSLRHYWYISWPDQKTPDKAPPLLELVQEVEEACQRTEGHGPVIVHCSAGIGRTGCFIATSICCKQLKNEGVVDILKTTCQLRLDRGGMIQTCEQYQFVHHVLSLYEKQLSCQVEE